MWCISGKGEAYGVLLEAIAYFVRDQNMAEGLKVLKRYMPTWLQQIPGLLDPVDFERLQSQVSLAGPEQMSREFCQAVVELSTAAPLIIVIEDLHWADISTIDLLAALAERPEPSKLLILGTYRPVDAVLYAKHLRDIVQELRMHNQCGEVMLELLSMKDVESYLRGRLDGEVSTELSAELFRRTEGNPMFMVNLVEDFIRKQIFVQREERWTFGDQAQKLDDEVPETLHSFISQRLDVLTGEQRQILEAASVVGIEFTSTATAGALRQLVEETDGQCESMVTQGLFIESIGLENWPDGTLTGRYRFQHSLYLEVLYEHIGDVRKARFHHHIGERLETGYGDRTNEIATALANHFDQGRDMDRAIRYRGVAAEQALNRHAYPEVIEHLTRAVNMLKQLPETPERDQRELDFLLNLGFLPNRRSRLYRAGSGTNLRSRAGVVRTTRR